MGLLDVIGNAASGFTNKVNSGDLDLALGLLAASAPRVGPQKGFGQVFGEAAQFASERDRARAANEFRRQQIEAFKTQQEQQKKELERQEKQRAAAQQAAQLLSGVGSGVLKPKQQNIPALLAQANPEAFTAAQIQGLFGTGRTNTLQQKIGTLENQLGRPLTESEISQIGGISPSREEALNIANLNAQLQINEQQLLDLQRQAKSAQTEQEREVLDRQVAAKSGVKQIRELVQLNEALAQANVPLSGLRRAVNLPPQRFEAEILELAGGDPARAEELRRAARVAERFDQLATKNALANLSTGLGVNANTDARFSRIIDTKPGLQVAPETNALAFADMIDTLLPFWRKAGIDEDFDSLKALADSLRKRNNPAASIPLPGGGVIRDIREN